MSVVFFTNGIKPENRLVFAGLGLPDALRFRACKRA